MLHKEIEKKIFVYAISILLLVSAAFAQSRVTNVPVYEGAVVGMEINISSKDMLPSIKTLFSMLPAKLGKVGALWR